MFSRAFSSFKYFRSVDVVTLNRFSDVVPVFSRPLTVHLSRRGPPPLPGVPRLTVHLSRRGPPPLPGVPRLTRSFSTNRKMPKKEKTVKGRAAGGAAGAAGAAGGAAAGAAAGGAAGAAGAAGGAEAGGSCPVSPDKSGVVFITVHAKPGSCRSAITDVGSQAVGVSIAAPPTDGEANAELVRFLAEVLELKKSHVCLHKGSRSRDKVIRLDSSLSPEEVLRRLREAAG
ncbi:UPF0235 protein C15orf40 homolog isoform X2 [Larimichthys crocea]|uniref:UPF0235 protein C15orf40 homolog isoform X2 n=1 Tax=Larimichthys crocea TaxID=215358 RepID=UPI000F5FEA9B|nr:UPF0235 protein C15orf40 homolog isoform X2 [Larimichthys crocea]